MTTDHTVRRVITAERDGVSYVALDEEPAPLTRPGSGMKYWPVWGRDAMTRLPFDGMADHEPSMFPATEHGFRAHVIEFPPAGSADVEGSPDWPPYGLPADRSAHTGSDGMHRTDTVDVIVVLSGEIDLAHSDGSVVRLTPGTVVVQNGADHAWRPTDVACRVCFVNLPAERAPREEVTVIGFGET